MGDFFENVPLVNGVFNSLSQASANEANIQAVRETNKANRELAEYQAAWNERMWNKQNAYNSPSEQMARFQEAGLNPNLMYSQGNPGNASSMPTYTSATMQAPQRRAIAFNFDQAVQTAMNLKSIKLQQEGKEVENEILGYQKDIAHQKAIQEVTATQLQNLLYRKELKNSNFYEQMAQYGAQQASGQADYWLHKGIGQELSNQYMSGKGDREWQQIINSQELTNLQRIRVNQAWYKLDLDERRVVLQEVLNQYKPHLDQLQIQRVAELIQRLDYENDILEVQRNFEQSFGTANTNAVMTILKSILYYLK